MVAITFSNCNSQNEKKFQNKAVAYENVDKYEEAIEQLDKVIDLNPKSEKAYLNRAMDKASIGNYESAIKDLDELIKLNKDAIEPLVWRAEYKRMIEQYEEAMQDIEKALKLKKPIYFGTNIIGPKEFKIDKLYPQGKNFNIEIEFIVFERGAANYHLGNYRQALLDLKFCEQPETQPINTHYYMGLTLLELGKTKEACSEFQKSFYSGELYAKELLDEYCNN